MKRPRMIDLIMAEPIRTPGFPQVVVTRGWLYQYLKNLGWDESERGFGSLDYTVFGTPIANCEVTAVADRDRWLSHPEIVEMYSRS